MNGDINNNNFNNQNMNIGQPIFNNPQNPIPQNNIQQASQMDMPPELGQIGNLSQSAQYVAPSLDPLDSAPAGPIQQATDPLDTYEQMGQSNVQANTTMNNYDNMAAVNNQPVINNQVGNTIPVQQVAVDMPVTNVQPVQVSDINGMPQANTTVVNPTPTINNQVNNQPAQPSNTIISGDNSAMFNQDVIMPQSPVMPDPVEPATGFDKDSYLVSRDETPEEVPSQTPEETAPLEADDSIVEETSTDDEIKEDEEIIETDDTKEESNSVEKIKEVIEKLKTEGNNIELEEFDFEEMYQLVVKIKK